MPKGGVDTATHPWRRIYIVVLAASAARGASPQKHFYVRYMSMSCYNVRVGWTMDEDARRDRPPRSILRYIYSTSTNHDWFQNSIFSIFFHEISKWGGTETTMTATTATDTTATTANRFDFIIYNVKDKRRGKWFGRDDNVQSEETRTRRSFTHPWRWNLFIYVVFSIIIATVTMVKIVATATIISCLCWCSTYTILCLKNKSYALHRMYCI
jgi:hypothetical protein